MLRIQQAKPRPQGPTTSASPGNLIEMQVVGFHPPQLTTSPCPNLQNQDETRQHTFSRRSKWFWWCSNFRATDSKAQSLRGLSAPLPKEENHPSIRNTSFEKIISCLAIKHLGMYLFQQLESLSFTWVWKGAENQNHLHQTYRGHWELKLLHSPPTSSSTLTSTTLFYSSVFISFLGVFFQAHVEVHHRKFLKETLQRKTSTGCLSPKILEFLASKSILCYFYQSWTVLSDLYPILIKSLHGKTFLKPNFKFSMSSPDLPPFEKLPKFWDVVLPYKHKQ